jgi:RNA polymerase sigma factor (sigma-70 family)
MKRSPVFHGSDADILHLIRNGEMEALVQLYERNHKPIVAFVTRNNGRSDDAEDMLQEALVILWERIRQGQYRLEAGINTFIYATVRNLWLRQLARKKKEPPLDSDVHEVEDPAHSSLEALIEDESANIVRKALDQIGQPCRSILEAFYWEELTMEDIARRFGFANAQTAKSKKYQCKKVLKELLQDGNLLQREK